MHPGSLIMTIIVKQEKHEQQAIQLMRINKNMYVEILKFAYDHLEAQSNMELPSPHSSSLVGQY